LPSLAPKNRFVRRKKEKKSSIIIWNGFEKIKEACSLLWRLFNFNKKKIVKGPRIQQLIPTKKRTFYLLLGDSTKRMWITRKPIKKVNKDSLKYKL
jgi:hypothetical protein